MRVTDVAHREEQRRRARSRAATASSSSSKRAGQLAIVLHDPIGRSRRASALALAALAHRELVVGASARAFADGSETFLHSFGGGGHEALPALLDALFRPRAALHEPSPLPTLRDVNCTRLEASVRGRLDTTRCANTWASLLSLARAMQLKRAREVLRGERFAAVFVQRFDLLWRAPLPMDRWIDEAAAAGAGAAAGAAAAGAAAAGASAAADAAYAADVATSLPPAAAAAAERPSPTDASSKDDGGTSPLPPLVVLPEHCEPLGMPRGDEDGRAAAGAVASAAEEQAGRESKWKAAWCGGFGGAEVPSTLATPSAVGCTSHTRAVKAELRARMASVHGKRRAEAVRAGAAAVADEDDGRPVPARRAASPGTLGVCSGGLVTPVGRSYFLLDWWLLSTSSAVADAIAAMAAPSFFEHTVEVAAARLASQQPAPTPGCSRRSSWAAACTSRGTSAAGWAATPHSPGPPR